MPSAKYSSSGRPRLSERKHHQHAPAWSIAPLDTPTGQRRHHRHHRHDRGCEDEQTGAHASAARPRSSSQRFRELGRRGEAIRRYLGQGLSHRDLDGGRRFGTQQAQRRGGGGQPFRDDCLRRGPGERGLPGQHRDQDAAQGVDAVPLSTRAVSARLLRAHVGRASPTAKPVPRQPFTAGGAERVRHAEVGDDRGAPREKKDVLRLDVPVHDALSARGAERLRYLASDARGLPLTRQLHLAS